MTNTINGMCDIGMASRELKQEELDQGLVNTVIATDGIAIIVNNDPPLKSSLPSRCGTSTWATSPIGRTGLIEADEHGTHERAVTLQPFFCRRQ